MFLGGDAVGVFLALQEITDKITLTCRRTFAPTKWEEKDVAMLGKDRANSLGRGAKCQITRAPMVLSAVAATVIIKNRRKGSRARRHPQVRFKAQCPALNLDRLRCDR